MLVAEKSRRVWEKDGEEDGEEKDAEDGEEKTEETVLREWVQRVKVRGWRLFRFVFCVREFGGGVLRWVLCAGYHRIKSGFSLPERDYFCIVEE